MKTIFKTILFIIFLLVIILILIINTPFNKYPKDIIHSEKDLLKNINTNTVNEKYITREKAVEKAIKVFKEGLGIEIDRNKLLEDINLYEYNNEYTWEITWNKKNKYEKSDVYFCSILADTGQVMNIGINKFEKYNDKYDVYNNEKIDLIDIREIIKPLEKELNINTGKLLIVEHEVIKSNLRVEFNNSKDNLELYEFRVDSKNKKILEYRIINTYKKK